MQSGFHQFAPRGAATPRRITLERNTYLLTTIAIDSSMPYPASSSTKHLSEEPSGARLSTYH
eukprot:scaffold3058_cov109-Skeletonema_marinoi.AAC.2